MTWHIERRSVGHHVRAMSPHAARIDRSPYRNAAEVARAHTRFGGSARVQSQKVSKAPSLMPEMPEIRSAVHPVAETAKCGRMAGGATAWSHPTVAFRGRIPMSRVSPSERQETALTGRLKRCQVRHLIPETGDTDRHRSEVRKMSPIPSLATTSSRNRAPGVVTRCGAEIAEIGCDYARAVAMAAAIAGASLRPQPCAVSAVATRSWRTSSEQCGSLRERA